MMALASFLQILNNLDDSKNYSHLIYRSPKKTTNFLSFVVVAQKMLLTCPLEVLNRLGGKSILSVARDTKYVGRLNFFEYIT